MITEDVQSNVGQETGYEAPHDTNTSAFMFIYIVQTPDSVFFFPSLFIFSAKSLAVSSWCPHSDPLTHYSWGTTRETVPRTEIMASPHRTHLNEAQHATRIKNAVAVNVTSAGKHENPYLVLSSHVRDIGLTSLSERKGEILLTSKVFWSPT